MSATVLAESPHIADGFRHEAFFYAGEHEFVAGASRFVAEAARASEPVLVVVSAGKIDLLRHRLKGLSKKVLFADMADVGSNPARIIPAWSDFVTAHEGQRLRGIGEPIWAGRTPAELVECQHHESLLNVAFAGSDDFTLMCPYDTVGLGADVIAEARRSHRFISGRPWPTASAHFLGLDDLARPLSQPLSEPPASSVGCTFGDGTLGGLRSIVWREAARAGLDEARSEDAVTAVNEVASNSIRHAGGGGVLRMWQSEGALICQISDDGHIDDPLVGRCRPGPDNSSGGRGLWMVNQLCDLVQVRSFGTGTTVRMHLCPQVGRASDGVDPPR